MAKVGLKECDVRTTRCMILHEDSLVQSLVTEDVVPWSLMDKCLVGLQRLKLNTVLISE